MPASVIAGLHLTPILESSVDLIHTVLLFAGLWLEYILASYSVCRSINVGVKLHLNIVNGISIEGAKVKFLVYELRCALRNYF